MSDNNPKIASRVVTPEKQSEEKIPSNSQLEDEIGPFFWVRSDDPAQQSEFPWSEIDAQSAECERKRERAMAQPIKRDQSIEQSIWDDRMQPVMDKCGFGFKYRNFDREVTEYDVYRVERLAFFGPGEYESVIELMHDVQMGISIGDELRDCLFEFFKRLDQDQMLPAFLELLARNGAPSEDIQALQNVEDDKEFLGNSTIAGEKMLMGYKEIAKHACRSIETVKKWRLIPAGYARYDISGRRGDKSNPRKRQVCIYPSALDRFFQNRENQKKK